MKRLFGRVLVICVVCPLVPTAHSAPTTLAIGDATTSANTQPTVLTFPIVRSGDVSFDTALSYHTIDGSARAGVDYTASTGTILLPAGQNNAGISIQLAPNTKNVGSLSFELALDGATAVGATGDLSLTNTFSTSGGAAVVATADLNGDGKMDLIVAHQGGVISVLLNTTVTAGTPTFAAEQTFTAGSVPLSVVATDINGDGKPDIVVADHANDSVVVLINTTLTGAAIASFAPPQVFVTGSGAHSVAAADVNKDGKVDLIIANYDQDTVAVLLNTTNSGAAIAQFAAPQTFSTGSGPWTVAVADIDSDGKPDLVTASYGENTISVLINATPNGSMTAAFGDQQRFLVGLGTEFLTALDVNTDGRPDIAVSSDGFNATWVLVNESIPGTSQAAFDAARLVNFDPYVSGRATSAEINGDGKSDLVLSDRSQGRIQVLTNTTAPGASVPSFARQQIFSSIVAAEDVAAYDVNNDGHIDIVAVNGSKAGVHLNAVGANAPLPVFDLEETFPVGQDGYGVAIADLNGDGRPDVAVASSYSDSVSTLTNLTHPGWHTLLLGSNQGLSAGNSPHSIAIADLTMDGRPDLAVANYSDHSLSIFVNETSQGAAELAFSAPQAFQTGENPWDVVAADINSDGKPDLLVTNYYDSGPTIFLNTSTPGSSAPTFSTPQTLTTGSAVRSAGLHDLNGDGKPDLVLAYAGSNIVGVLINTTSPGSSTATFATQQTFAVGTFPYAVALADMDGDGKLDIVTSNYGDGTISVLLNATDPGSSTSAFGLQQVFAVGVFPYSLVVADLEGKGKQDVITGNFGHTGSDMSLSILLNTTVPGSNVLLFSAEPTLGIPFAPSYLASADLNGDGRPDLIASHWGGTTVSAFLSAQYRTDLVGSPAYGTITHDTIFSNGFEG